MESQSVPIKLKQWIISILSKRVPPLQWYFIDIKLFCGIIMAQFNPFQAFHFILQIICPKLNSE